MCRPRSPWGIAPVQRKVESRPGVPRQGIRRDPAGADLRHQWIWWRRQSCRAKEEATANGWNVACGSICFPVAWAWQCFHVWITLPMRVLVSMYFNLPRCVSIWCVGLPATVGTLHQAGQSALNCLEAVLKRGQACTACYFVILPRVTRACRSSPAIRCSIFDELFVFASTNKSGDHKFVQWVMNECQGSMNVCCQKSMIVCLQLQWLCADLNDCVLIKILLIFDRILMSTQSLRSAHNH